MTDGNALGLGLQIVWLLVLSIPVACVAWTITHEEIFKEPREYCERRSESDPRLLVRKFFYLFTCEYCFSHYVSALTLVVTRFQLLYAGWRGYVVAGFSMVFIANVYMALFARAKLGVKKDRVEIEHKEQAVERRAADAGERRAGDEADRGRQSVSGGGGRRGMAGNG